MDKRYIWQKLEEHAHTPISSVSREPTDEASYTISACNISLNYAKQHIHQETLEELFALADACNLKDNIQALMSGAKINHTEDRPALHTALRVPEQFNIIVNERNIVSDVLIARQKMQQIVEQIRAKRWLGYTQKPVTDIVNIGIGGSDLGPRFCLKAFSAYTTRDLKFHFISDADPNSFQQVAEYLNPETTLFIVVSKSFTTPETLYNAKKALTWLGQPNHVDKHFIAITANVEKPLNLSIKTVLPIWDWVGGRFSFCSAVNLITAIAIGFDAFNELLKGAHCMDQHFQQTEFKANLPVMLALLGIWNNNFLKIHTLLMLSYAQQLEFFVPFIQQLEMESNGKSVDRQGNRVAYNTAPIVWGGLGNQAQHSYYQLLCQGTHQVTVDFIKVKNFDGHMINDLCESNLHILSDGYYNEDNIRVHIPGKIPLNLIQIEQCTPYILGALVALYEHKTFVQSVIWDINPFDQPGVESAKKHRPVIHQPHYL